MRLEVENKDAALLWIARSLSLGTEAVAWLRDLRPSEMRVMSELFRYCAESESFEAMTIEEGRPRELKARNVAVKGGNETVQVNRNGWLDALDRAADLVEYVGQEALILRECGKRSGLSPEACAQVADRMLYKAANAVPREAP